MRFWIAALFCSPLLAGCDDAPKREAAAETPAQGRVEIVAAPAGNEEATAVVVREAARAKADGKKLVVYVGAEWCEPCQHFKHAAADGRLDAAFPGLRVLEFDRDRDEARLGRAGCLSRLIPLFALPDEQGRCSARRMEGSIKGPGAVEEIKPRLAALLR